jgi:thiol-disulfide isomerase/thioredoxin
MASKLIEQQRYIILGVAVVLIAVGIYYFESQKSRPVYSSLDSDIETPRMTETTEEKEKKYERAKEISSPDGFINVDDINITDLIGSQVILVDFWTYSCINCQRTLPYLNAWHEKYGDKGLTIIGMHTPEFEFEEDYGNVSRAVEKFGVKYPVVLDNDFSTWTAYRNQYWPRKYLIDIDGFIVYDHIGEGAYEETERKIQELLNERMITLGEEGDIASEIANPKEDRCSPSGKPQTPEIYFGAWRNNYFGNGERLKEGAQSLSIPNEIGQHFFYLDGDWTIDDKHAINSQSGARIVINYQAECVFMVAGSDKPVKMFVLRDGKPIGNAAGSDVKDGSVTVSEETLYRIVEDPEGWGQHTLELIIEGAGLEAFTFTFG